MDTAKDSARGNHTARYVVYPLDGTNKAHRDIILSTLLTYASDPDTIYTSQTRALGVNFWRVDLTDSQAEELRNKAEVATVNIDSASFETTFDPTA
ncbi:hypothetical protein B0H63DRAFT_271782 [Podospora didyma]|uniref:Inhibitor I9 domain-containing protein n=1 Tax=Podospora didyma TaxID=330526 RepID=A0AAE0N8Z7_9PEZI|nr:hypothetical protein B0H63DRAFT_271782 [Podospora didyma]